MTAQERINFKSGTEEQMKLRKESNMFNSLSQKTFKMHKGEKKNKHTVIDPTPPKSTRNQKIPLNNKPKCRLVD
jgi:hypothetical protein